MRRAGPGVRPISVVVATDPRAVDLDVATVAMAVTVRAEVPAGGSVGSWSSCHSSHRALGGDSVSFDLL